MKHTYQLIINGGKQSKTPYIYQYGNTKDVLLSIKSNNALISFAQSVDRLPEKIRSGEDDICSDAIKKAMLIHLILYAKPLTIRKLTFLKDDQETVIYDKEEKETLVFSMVEQPLDHPLPVSWHSKTFIETILNTPKSKYDGRNNALIALLIGKAKPYRSEKSMYLWMAMNGLYGFLALEANRNAMSNKKKIKKEWQEQDLLCIVSGISLTSENLTEEQRRDLMQRAISWLKRCDETPEQLHQLLSSKENAPCFQEIKDKLQDYQLDMGLEAFLSIWLPYRIRCNYFHADKAIPLFSYAEDKMLKALAYTNYFVEQFVEDHLPQWLYSRELSDNQKLKIRKAYQDIIKT